MPSTIMRQLLRSRDLQTDIQNLPDTLSSWDKCMAKDYCKYPVIAGCIIGGLILISLIWCFIRCCMCGYACCTCCCGGCGGRRPRNQKHQVEFVPVHPHSQQPPPSFHQPPAYREEPQYAYTTDRDGKVSADALPAMPVWETTKIEVQEEVEMGYVNNEGYKKSPGMDYGHGHTVPVPQQRSLTTPAPEPYARQQHRSPSPTPAQRVLSPGPMQAPIPVNPSGQKMGFNPRGPSPAPYQYEDRDPIQDNYGYASQQGPRWGNQTSQTRNPYDLPYDDAPEPVHVQTTQQQYGANADYYNTYSAPEPQQQLQRSNSNGVGTSPSGGYAAYNPSPQQHQRAAPYPTAGQSMYPVDDRPYDYDDPNRRRQDPWSAL